MSRHCRQCGQVEDDCWCGDDAPLTEAVPETWRDDASGEEDEAG